MTISEDGSDTQYFYVDASLRHLLKISKINSNAGRLARICDIGGTKQSRQPSRIYVWDELVALLDGPLAARLKKNDVDPAVLREISCYLWGGTLHFNIITPCAGQKSSTKECVYMQRIDMNASTFLPQEIKLLADTRKLLLASPRGGFFQALEQLISLFSPLSSDDDAGDGAGNGTAYDPHISDRFLVTTLLSLLVNNKLDRDALLYNFLVDQVKGASTSSGYVQFSQIVKDFACILYVRCGSRPGRLLRGPGSVNKQKPLINLFWPTDQTCQREIKKNLPIDVIGFDLEAMRRIIAVGTETEEMSGVKPSYHIGMDGTDVRPGEVTLTKSDRLINGSDVGGLDELVFSDYPINDHQVKAQVEDVCKRWEQIEAKAGKQAISSSELQGFVDPLRSRMKLVYR